MTSHVCRLINSKRAILSLSLSVPSQQSLFILSLISPKFYSHFEGKAHPKIQISWFTPSNYHPCHYAVHVLVENEKINWWPGSFLQAENNYTKNCSAWLGYYIPSLKQYVSQNVNLNYIIHCQPVSELLFVELQWSDHWITSEPNQWTNCCFVTLLFNVPADPFDKFVWKIHTQIKQNLKCCTTSKGPVRAQTQINTTKEQGKKH